VSRSPRLEIVVKFRTSDVSSGGPIKVPELGGFLGSGDKGLSFLALGLVTLLN
jgi:hypothetical protein